nr:Down syndrome cell adhesion molecule-like protein 1 homolog [Parasteatoda tepidariorum]
MSQEDSVALGSLEAKYPGHAMDERICRLNSEDRAGAFGEQTGKTFYILEKWHCLSSRFSAHSRKCSLMLLQNNIIILTDPTGSIPPRITSGRTSALVQEGGNAEIPCTAQGYPVPQYTWYRRENNRLIPMLLGDRMLQVNGSLFIERARVQDTGKYICIVNNSIGEVRVETELTVYGNLSVSLHPSQITTESGRSATLNCSVQGYPVHSITWLKDARHLITSNRVRLIANQVLHITSVQREDQGMYQCFVYGSQQSIQSGAQLILSGKSVYMHQLLMEFFESKFSFEIHFKLYNL